MADRKAKFALISYFQKLYLRDAGKRLVINKYIAQWDADALIDSYGKETATKLVDRYFSLSDNPSWRSFARDAQKLYDGMVAEEEDKAARATMRRKFNDWINQ